MSEHSETAGLIRWCKNGLSVTYKYGKLLIGVGCADIYNVSLLRKGGDVL